MSTDASEAGGIHLDETGAPCTRHPRLSARELHALAVVGSRVAGFSHDVASKLQRIIMSLGEIEELAEAVPAMREALDSAQLAVSELHALFVDNRAAAKPPVRGAITLQALVTAAQARVGLVVVPSALPVLTLALHVIAVTHALAQLLDLTAVVGPAGRTSHLTVQSTATTATLLLATSGSHTARADTLALATFVVGLSGGTLSCTPNSIVLQLPLATDADELGFIDD
ncbi:MAG: hypothetical protein H0T79_12155 [Deltaproteobacteria bacterium]|nr:hypothetical protein [Deltaproteobacteria bacterium]